MMWHPILLTCIFHNSEVGQVLSYRYKRTPPSPNKTTIQLKKMGMVKEAKGEEAESC